jgi:hypothetical protein
MCQGLCPPQEHTRLLQASTEAHEQLLGARQMRTACYFHLSREGQQAADTVLEQLEATYAEAKAACTNYAFPVLFTAAYEAQRRSFSALASPVAVAA